MNNNSWIPALVTLREAKGLGRLKDNIQVILVASHISSTPDSSPVAHNDIFVAMVLFIMLILALSGCSAIVREKEPVPETEEKIKSEIETRPLWQVDM